MGKDTTRPKAIDLIVSNEIKKYLKNNSSIGKPTKKKAIYEGVSRSNSQISQKMVRVTLDNLLQYEDYVSRNNKYLRTIHSTKDDNLEEIRTDLYYQPTILDEELQIFIDLLAASPLFTKKQKDDLILKLKLALNDELVEIKPHSVQTLFTESAVKTSLIKNLAQIRLAMENKRAIDFTFCGYEFYGKEKRLILKNQREITQAQPQAVYLKDGYYYVEVKFPDSNKKYNYRVELMKNIQITKIAYTIDHSNFDNLKANRSDYYPLMMGGKVENYILRIKKEDLTRLIRLFNSEVRLYTKEKEYYDVEIRATKEGMLRCLLLSPDIVQAFVIPERGRKQMKNKIQNLLDDLKVEINKAQKSFFDNENNLFIEPK